jgi:hypothetical protein
MDMAETPDKSPVETVPGGHSATPVKRRVVVVPPREDPTAADPKKGDGQEGGMRS